MDAWVAERERNKIKRRDVAMLLVFSFLPLSRFNSLSFLPCPLFLQAQSPIGMKRKANRCSYMARSFFF